MSVATVVTMGYGVQGTVAYVTRLGYGALWQETDDSVNTDWDPEDAENGEADWTPESATSGDWST